MDDQAEYPPSGVGMQRAVCAAIYCHRFSTFIFIYFSSVIMIKEYKRRKMWNRTFSV
jgi:hypothetical protein